MATWGKNREDVPTNVVFTFKQVLMCNWLIGEKCREDMAAITDAKLRSQKQERLEQWRKELKDWIDVLLEKCEE